MLQSRANSAKDAEIRAELTVLIEKMTTTGQPVLDENQLKSLKRICRQSDDYVRHVFHMLMTRLNKHHAEVRLSAFQICEELFVRSHCFRDLLLSEMQNFLKLVLEVDVKYPLPPPKKAAADLQRLAKKTLKNWFDKFGQTYKKLALCYNYLSKSKQIDFSDDQRTVIQQQQESLRLQKLQAINEQRLNRTLKEIQELSEEIELSTSEAESCIELLLESAGLFDDNDFCSNQSVVMSTTDNDADLQTDSNTNIRVKDRSSRKSGDDGVAAPEPECSLSVSEKLVENADLRCSDKLYQTVRRNSATCNVDEGNMEGFSYANSSNENSINLNDQHNSTEQHGSCSSNDAEQIRIGTRHHGLHSCGPTLHINVNKDINIQETEDNLVLIRNLQDQYSLLSNRYLPTVKKWLEVLAKVGASEDNVKKALDVKSAIESTLQRIHKLNVPIFKEQSTVVKQDVDDENSDSEDFEEVPTKDGFEEHVPLHLLNEACCHPASLPSSSAAENNVSWFIKDRLRDVEDPTTCSAVFQASSKDEECQPSTSGTKNTSGSVRAPVVSYGSDLCFWGDTAEAPLLTRNNPETNWWSKSADDTVDVMAVQASKSRVIDFSGSYQPVKWKCRAPLADGSLCSRMDRLKCPFHGKIVARDEKGIIQNQSSASANNLKLPADDGSKPNDWDDPELQADIQAATGVNLCRKGRGAKKGKLLRQQTKSGLTDIRSEQKNTARKRLEAKVLSRSATKRVAHAMNALESQMLQKKFASSFKYTFRS